jgi:alkanesulfonate monooxygenase SsuD/methylene tetrahydromethanopterin reductase-like flavin-dependent oxidoreductase (luciferase family)
MRFHLELPAGSHPRGGNVRGLVDIARRAEAAGVDGVVISDHVVMGSRLDRNPFGTFPFPPQEP